MRKHWRLIWRVLPGNAVQKVFIEGAHGIEGASEDFGYEVPDELMEDDFASRAKAEASAGPRMRFNF